ncbi:zinc ribbon domain-containing protein [Mailhella sp.]|uniref:zinc ribbon domain-containing protein n=1 Tax=Mailhella sp. TaxID=1981029 RepID=UPI00406323A2
MNCPNCKASIPDDSRSCPHCGQPVIHAREVIDAELVGSPQTRQEQYREQQSGGQSGFYRHVVFTSTGGSQMLPSCQMGIITLALAFVMGLQFGLLACIGFLVFAGIARVITFLINVQLAMMGRPLNPLLLQILSWFCCWSLVAWLAS